MSRLKSSLSQKRICQLADEAERIMEQGVEKRRAIWRAINFFREDDAIENWVAVKIQIDHRESLARQAERDWQEFLWEQELQGMQQMLADRHDTPEFLEPRVLEDLGYSTPTITKKKQRRRR